jgi:hypothetical protein
MDNRCRHALKIIRATDSMEGDEKKEQENKDSNDLGGRTGRF